MLRMSVEEYKRLLQKENKSEADPLNQIKYGNLGMNFEDDLDLAHTAYEKKEIAIINKRPTPIQVIDNLDQNTVKGIFTKKSTVDYDGTYEGYSIVFEAKSTKKEYFPLQNVGKHQVEYLQKQHKVGAICFLLIHFELKSETYLIPFQNFLYYWERWKPYHRGVNHIPYADFEQYALKVKSTHRARLDYLQQVDALIRLRNKQDLST